MITAKIFKLQTTGWQCDNEDCKHNLKYHINIIGHVYHLKTDEICLSIRLHGAREIYCRDCIDVVYQKLKPILDSKLWIFE